MKEKTMSEKKIEANSLEDVNQKIQELYTYLPKEIFRDDKAPRTKDGKPNKGMILTAAVSHLLSLQNDVDTSNREEVELLARLEELKQQELEVFGRHIVDTSSINFEHTSAEVALGKIGVGPLASDTVRSPERTVASPPKTYHSPGVGKPRGPSKLSQQPYSMGPSRSTLVKTEPVSDGEHGSPFSKKNQDS